MTRLDGGAIVQKAFQLLLSSSPARGSTDPITPRFRGDAARSVLAVRKASNAPVSFDEAGSVPHKCGAHAVRSPTLVGSSGFA